MNKKQNVKPISTPIPGIAYYARVIEPHPDTNKFDQGKYTISLEVAPKVVKALEKAAMEFGKAFFGKDPTLFFVKPLENLGKTDVIAAKTKFKPEVLDEFGEVVTELIGNGSEVSIKASMFTWHQAAKVIQGIKIPETNGVSLYLNAVTVNKLIPYTEGGGDAVKLDIDSSSSDVALDF